MLKKLILLACSYRPGGRCVAGIEIVDNRAQGWVRPVCLNGEGQVHDSDRICLNQHTANKLSVIQIDFTTAQNHPMQKENMLFTHDAKWTHVGNYLQAHEYLSPLLQRPTSLWENGLHSTNGINDKVPVGIVRTSRDSLYFIRPTRLFVHIATEGEAFDNPQRKVRARFYYNSVEYMFSLTDAMILEQYANHRNGEYEINNCYLVVSLGGEHLGYYWKIAAAIYEVQE